VKTRSLKLPANLDSRLDQAAQRRGVSRSAVVREAVEAYLDRDTEPAARSLLARVRDLAGCVDGPPDLSVNERYLDGYGAAARRRAPR
jgi:predicted DNA-binding protein